METNKNKGFTLVELIVYAAGLIILLSIIVYVIYQMYSIYSRVTVEPRVDRVAISMMNSIVRDIRSGESINLAESGFGVPYGFLTVSSKEEGVYVEKKYNFQGERVLYSEGGGDPEFMSPEDVQVSRFYFTYITSSVSEAVRVEMDITFNMKGESKTKSYEGLGIMRHSYE